MKKQIYYITLSIFLCFLLVSCGENTQNNADIDELKAKITELETENEELKKQIAETKTIENSKEENKGGEVSTPEKESISLGETITIPDLCEFTINSADLKKEVNPPKPTGYYTYYPEEDGKTYIDVIVTTKNTRTTARTASDFGTVKAICGTGYEYLGFSIIEESKGNDFTYTNITNINPLETAIIHYLISIPNELADDSTVPIILDVTMLEKEYTVSIR